MAYGACANDMRSSRDALAKSRFPGVGKGLKTKKLVRSYAVKKKRTALQFTLTYCVDLAPLLLARRVRARPRPLSRRVSVRSGLVSRHVSSLVRMLVWSGEGCLVWSSGRLRGRAHVPHRSMLTLALRWTCGRQAARPRLRSAVRDSLKQLSLESQLRLESLWRRTPRAAPPVGPTARRSRRGGLGG